MTELKTAHRLSIIAACCLAFGANADDDDLLSRDALFGDDLPKTSSAPRETGPGIKGFVQFEAARTTAAPEHWSKLRTRAELGSAGKLGEGLKWKLGARFDYDFVYGINNFYPADVEKNQRRNIELRENYLDYSNGNWDFRFGKQHVVWGEMVGLFFADVVSARDLREFILPEFDQMRIPQWAARAEYFSDDFHAELLWIPVASYDQIGKPGAEFYPCQPFAPCTSSSYRQERTPERNLSNGNYGARLSALKGGWDISGFFYSSMDIAPTFYRELVGQNAVFQARHDRINQTGGTIAKDFGSVVFKAEAVYTHGRKFGVTRLSDADGLVPQNTVDWAAGLDFSLPADTRFNVQFFQRAYTNHDADIVQNRRENGYSLYLNGRLNNKLEAQIMFISSLNRPDWLLRPKLTWAFERNWRLVVGADVFYGAPLGLFGQYDDKDRVFSEVRYSY